MPDTHVVCFGVSHHHAPVEVRERIRFALFDGRALVSSHRNNTTDRNDELTDPPFSSIREMVLLSTCNRVELYACVDGQEASSQRVLFNLVEEASQEARRRAGFTGGADSDFTPEFLNKVTYYYEGADAVRHLCSVACGLESMILGETQILSQINEAYNHARDAGLVGGVLSAVFHTAQRAGKRARTDTAISASPSSMSSAAVALAQEHVGDLSQRDIAVVGLGEMGRLALKMLYTRGVRHIRLVNRTVEKASALAEHIMMHTDATCSVYGLDDLDKALETADAVITATHATEWILGTETTLDVMKRRGGRDLVLIDIAVPRNIDPDAGRVAGVKLFDTDDIQAVKDHAVDARRKEIPKVEAIIEEEIERIKVSLRRVKLKPLIAELRQKAEAIRQSELDRTYRILGSPDPETWRHVQRMSSALVNKLFHNPTMFIQEKAASGNADVYAETIRELFGLNGAAGDHEIPPDRHTDRRAEPKAPSRSGPAGSGQGRPRKGDS